MFGRTASIPGNRMQWLFLPPASLFQTFWHFYGELPQILTDAATVLLIFIVSRKAQAFMLHLCLILSKYRTIFVCFESIISIVKLSAVHFSRAI